MFQGEVFVDVENSSFVFIRCLQSFLLRFSERCQLQQVALAVSSTTSGMESPMPITPRIVTPSATTLPFFPTLPAPSRGGSASGANSRQSSRQASPHRDEKERIVSEKMERQEETVGGSLTEGQEDSLQKLVGESPIPSVTRGKCEFLLNWLLTHPAPCLLSVLHPFCLSIHPAMHLAIHLAIHKSNPRVLSIRFT